jgi:hypothetical protein
VSSFIRGVCAALLFACATAITANAAAAKPASDESAKDEADKTDDEPTFGHGFQFGLRGGVVLGYKMDFRYDKSPFCQKPDTKPPGDQQKVCGFGTSPAFEGALSFGVLDSIEPYLFGRFGFSNDTHTNTDPLLLVGAGARVYTMSDSRFKLFVEPALAWELEGGAGDPAYSPPTLHPSYKRDLVFHIGVGPQYDFAKVFGLYLNAGLDVGVLRSISATLLLNVGVQFRAP